MLDCHRISVLSVSGLPIKGRFLQFSSYGASVWHRQCSGALQSSACSFWATQVLAAGNPCHAWLVHMLIGIASPPTGCGRHGLHTRSSASSSSMMQIVALQGVSAASSYQCTCLQAMILLCQATSTVWTLLSAWPSRKLRSLSNTGSEPASLLHPCCCLLCQLSPCATCWLHSTALYSVPQIIKWRDLRPPTGPQSVCPHDITGSDTVSPSPAGTRCMLSPACWWEAAS